MVDDKPRPRLLDTLCHEALIVNIYDGDVLLGSALTTLEKLIHADREPCQIANEVELTVPIIWIRTKKVAATEASAEGSGADDSGEPEVQKPEEEEEEEDEPEADPGALTLRVTASECVGRTYCTVDIGDWAKVTVQVHGLYSLPEKLCSINGQIPKTHDGIVEDHPFSYHFRMIGIEFDDGYVVNPPHDSPEPSDNEGDEVQGEELENECKLRVALTDFAEGLIRVGYTALHEDVMVIFSFLDNASGTVGVAEFSQLQTMDCPAELDAMVSFRTFLLSKHATLQEAYEAFPKCSDVIDLDGFQEGCATMEYDGDNVVSIFLALDIKCSKVVSWEEFQTLNLFMMTELIQNVERQRDWMLNTFGSVNHALKRIDENNSGRISREEWGQAMERLGYSDEASKFSGFSFMDTAQSGIVRAKEFKILVHLGKEFLQELKKFVAFFGDNLASVFQEMCGENRQALKAHEFRTACKRLGYSGKGTRTIHNFLDTNRTGSISISEFLLLRAFNSMAARGVLPQFKAYIVERFADLKDAFALIFGDPADFYEVAETKMPRVEFPHSSFSVYKGRAWLQQFYNMLDDPRGRMVADTHAGGIWMYIFPKLKNAELPLGDFKDATEMDKARIARWHHGQMFADFRQFKDNEDVRNQSTLTFRSFLARVREVTDDVNEGGDLPRAPFEVKRTYIKITLSFDRVLPELCPRNVPVLDPSYVPDSPPAPESPLEFDEEIRLTVAQIATAFGQCAKQENAMKPQICGPCDEENEYQLLGPLGPQTFMDFLFSSGYWDRLLTSIQHAMSKIIKQRQSTESLPMAGLYGDERDAKYSGIRDDFVNRILMRLNDEIKKQKWRRDTKFWMNPSLYSGEADNFWDPEDVKVQQLARCKQLQRLVFECETYGDHGRAMEFFRERLRLPHNRNEPSVWYAYARFLMRCGQRQLDAEDALRFSLSLTSVDQADDDTILFLACCLLNRAGACSLPDAPREVRFSSARALFTVFSARNPTDPTCNFFLFLLYAMEAKFKQDDGLSNEWEMAWAAKYLALAKAPPEFFTSILPSMCGGIPHFPELAELYKLERSRRGEVQPSRHGSKLEAPGQDNRYPAFCKYEQVRKLPLDEDKVVLDAIDRVLEFGLPNFVCFLIREGVELYKFISDQTRNSDRCTMQLVKSHMMLGDFADATEVCQSLLQDNDRFVEAWILFGESQYRMALQTAPGNSHYDKSLEAFEEALKFLPSENLNADAVKILRERTMSAKVSNRDPVIFIRIGSIYFFRQEYQRAKDHYIQSLMQAPTAEGWYNAGVCALHLARTLKDPAAYLNEAFTCLLEANLMDRTRPKIWAWLTVCAAEKGERHLAVQAFRYAVHGLDTVTALELVKRFLHLSNTNGLYAHEATILLRMLIDRGDDDGDVHLSLARALVMRRQFPQALVEMRRAIAWLYADDETVDRIFDEAQAVCVKHLPDQPRLIALLKQDVLFANERRGNPDAELLELGAESPDGN